MEGIEVFLVLKENREDVCYFETNNVGELHNGKYAIMHKFVGVKYGMSLIGKASDEELIKEKLLKKQTSDLDKERKALNKKEILLKELKGEN